MYLLQGSSFAGYYSNMRKTTKVAILCSTILLNGFNKLLAQDITTTINTVKSAFFKVSCFDSKSKIVGTGSGFFISSDGVGVSNIHVFEGAKSASIELEDGSIKTIESIMDFSRSNDLVKFKVKNIDHQNYLKISEKELVVGQSIFCIGSPLGYINTVSTGIISSLRRIQDYGEVIQITAPITHGSSGGGLLNYTGQLIGITTFGVSGNGNINFAISSKHLSELNASRTLTISEFESKLFHSDLMLAALFYHSVQKWDSAHLFYTRYIQEQPSDYLGYLRRGNLYMDLGKYKDAIVDYRMALLRNDQSELIYANLGLALAHNGELGAGYEACLRSIQLAPTAQGYYNLGWIAFEGKQYNVAIRAMTDALVLDPSNPMIFHERAEAKALYGDLEGAIEDYTLELKLRPNRPTTIASRGALYLMLSMNHEGCKDLIQARALGLKDVSDHIEKNCVTATQKYAIVVGSFETKSGAEQFLNDDSVSKEGCQIIESDGKFRVAFVFESSKEVAKTKLESSRKTHPNCWLLSL
ncbi:MAG: trypsin-like peptidase domain-containing protein [Bacteroidetes bacterium]|nr:trypsin-like peptidase domain-containing protein [Bacteroidota bacterium]